MTILISPLNWGLGHATRIVPLIKYLSQKHRIIIATDGIAYDFLKKEFPKFQIIKLKTFEIKYTSKKFLMPLKIFFLLPLLIKSYSYNKLKIRELQTKHKPDIIISDNRFGFFSKQIKSIFITHQLNISVPKYLKIFKPLIDFLNITNIQKFDEIWIPDDRELKISGKLSIKKIKKPIFYAGLLSRFEFINELTQVPDSPEYLGIVSGPEPQKSIFCNLLKKIFLQTNKKSVIICGDPARNYDFNEDNSRIISHLNDYELAKFILSSKKIITRAGYSSIMDLLTLKRTALLVPTPGQTEQEYLADYLHNKKLFFSVQQKELNINALSKFDKKFDILADNVSSLHINKVETFLRKRNLL